MANIKQITLPDGNTYDIVDAGARQLIEDLGDALYWIGVTTTELTDGSTTNPITVLGESVTAEVGGMAQYSGEEFVWNGSAWQSMGKNNFGDLAFADTAEGSYTPAGTIDTPSITVTPSSTSVSRVLTLGTLPTYTVANEVLTLTAGALPTKEDVSVLNGATAALAAAPAFTGTAATITVAPPTTP